MDGKPPPPARDDQTARGEPDPIVSFVESDSPEEHPRLLVERLLYARTLLQANVVLAPRFQLGDCAAAHHIVFGSAGTARAVTERLRIYGFRVEPWTAPPGIRFFLSSSHTEPEIRALLIAITIVVREHTSAVAGPGIARKPG